MKYSVLVKSIGFDEKSTRVLLSADDLTEDLLKEVFKIYGNAANRIQVWNTTGEDEEDSASDDWIEEWKYREREEE